MPYGYNVSSWLQCKFHRIKCHSIQEVPLDEKWRVVYVRNNNKKRNRRRTELRRSIEV